MNVYMTSLCYMGHFLSLKVFKPKNSQKEGILPTSPRLSRQSDLSL